MKINNYILLLMLTIAPYLSFSQIECLKYFNSFVYKSLSDLSGDSIDVSSNNIRIVFELYVSECGKVDSVTIRKSNLNNFSISETALISSIIGRKFTCLWEDYYYYKYKGKLLPDKVIIIYNTKILEDK